MVDHPEQRKVIAKSTNPPSVRSHAFLLEVELPRQMDVNEDVVLLPNGATPDAAQRAVLSLLYGEVCDSWHELVGVRFKLLALVPSVSVITLGILFARTDINPILAIGLSAFGVIVTAMLMIYDQRNSQLHNELISRGRRIEYELGVSVGQFLGRPKSRRLIKHDIATLTIYLASIGGWVFGLLYAALHQDG
ncbi:hypothetical protein [Rhodococcus sp. M8-35]|uniref:hypothetical protein n=1 Tax=Rhodococcus sp. M8-35 TaxID=3058401 RepID=UPI002ED36C03